MIIQCKPGVKFLVSFGILFLCFILLFALAITVVMVCGAIVIRNAELLIALTVTLPVLVLGIWTLLECLSFVVKVDIDEDTLIFYTLLSRVQTTRDQIRIMRGRRRFWVGVQREDQSVRLLHLLEPFFRSGDITRLTWRIDIQD